MDFLKTFFWVIISALVVVVAINNWTPVTLNLWSGLQADVKLPALLLVIFLIGFLPAMIYYRTKQWRLARRLDTLEREVSDLRGITRFQAPERAAEDAAPRPPETDRPDGRDRGASAEPSA